LLLPQRRFLELLTSEAGRYPSFRLVMGARVESVMSDGGRIRGVRYRSQADGSVHELPADLTIAADGRFSKIRQLVGFQPVSVVQPIDCLWFRLPHMSADPPDGPGVYVGGGRVMVVFDRGHEWQMSYWLPKGSYQQLRAAGIANLQPSVAELAAWSRDRVACLQDWSKASLLTVESSRLRRWYQPGLLLIGDAAHVMAPVGGVGINLAIQDAVAAANVLTPRLRGRGIRLRDLAAVQRRREFSTQLVQHLQAMTQRQMLRMAEFDDRDKPPAIYLAPRPAASKLTDFPSRVFACGGPWPEPVNV
jgi:2-polyprenyl-6-methoxyphenol hydroxylase-like FAD-dependent oxidoreductase